MRTGGTLENTEKQKKQTTTTEYGEEQRSDEEKEGRKGVWSQPYLQWDEERWCVYKVLSRPLSGQDDWLVSGGSGSPMATLYCGN